MGKVAADGNAYKRSTSSTEDYNVQIFIVLLDFYELHDIVLRKTLVSYDQRVKDAMYLLRSQHGRQVGNCRLQLFHRHYLHLYFR